MADNRGDNVPDLSGEVLRNMGLFLMGQVMGSDEAGMEIGFTGTFYHMRVRNPAGTQVAYVIGKDGAELADQLALAIFHDIPEDRLCTLHGTPLNKPVQLKASNNGLRPAKKKQEGRENELECLDPDDEKGAQFGEGVFQCLGLFLIRLKVGEQDIQIQQCISGDTLHVRVKVVGGDVVYQVSGQDTTELGDQLALACFHDLTVERLRELHCEPLKKLLQVQK